ncbi:MAG: DNA repair protein RecN [Holophagae bacterium]|jgi:DNA repair protein RecN (Recombination protein N)
MLERLSVHGLGIISAVDLEFEAGFAVLTGETGAGKSLLIESLKLLAGQRAQSEMVRTGDERLRVEGVFAFESDSPVREILDELGLEESNSIVIRREVTQSGRGRAWINDLTVTASSLQRVAPHLLSIHGQHEQHGLSDSDVQRRLVDDFGSHVELLEETKERFAKWRSAADELDQLRGQQATRRDRLDTISFQLHEIDAIGPTEGEDHELRTRRQLLRHAVRIADLRSTLLDRLSDSESSVIGEMARAERELVAIADCGISLEGGVDRLVEARVHVEEVVRELQSLGEVATDPNELESTESRLHVLEQLMLKYGSTLSEVLAHRQELIEERAELESVEDRLELAVVDAEHALAEFDRSATALHEARTAAGVELTAAVEEVLASLAMGGTRLVFQWQARSDASSPLARNGEPVAFEAAGVEECVLLIAANPGEEPRPMARIASGGELSRVHLALRTVLRKRRPTRGLTLLFDEVDSGLGGSTAAALAELLADLAADDQVLVVTHLPQVAARGKGHFRVDKVVDEGRATTRVEALEDAEREAEVARMLAGGELTESARAHARVLLGGA